MTDFRALCAELLNAYEQCLCERGNYEQWLLGSVLADRARAALAQPEPQPIPVSERLPGPEDCDAEGRCWWWYPEVPSKTYGYWAHEDDAMERAVDEQPVAWLPAHAQPLPLQ